MRLQRIHVSARISNMSDPSTSSRLRGSALQGYENSTGTKLVEHPLSKQELHVTL